MSGGIVNQPAFVDMPRPQRRVIVSGGTDLSVADGGTGRSSHTDGGLLIGKGSAALENTGEMADGELVVGDGTTNPVLESGTTLRTSIGVGTGDSPQFTGIELGAASDTTLTRASAGDMNIEGNIVHRVGGTDVAVADGGTGASSHTDGGLLIGKGSAALENTGALADGTIVVGDGATNPATLAAFSSATGTLKVANGGTAGATAAAALTNLGVANHDSIVVSAAGEAINAEQPCFLVHPTSGQDNISVGSDVTVVFGTEIFDQNSDFATNTFTAPVTGRYHFSCFLLLGTVDSVTTSFFGQFVASNRDVRGFFLAPDKQLSADTTVGVAFSAYIDMDALDTCHVIVNQADGTQQTDISGGSTDQSHFSGALIT